MTRLSLTYFHDARQYLSTSVISAKNGRNIDVTCVLLIFVYAFTRVSGCCCCFQNPFVAHSSFKSPLFSESTDSISRSYFKPSAFYSTCLSPIFKVAGIQLETFTLTLRSRFANVCDLSFLTKARRPFEKWELAESLTLWRSGEGKAETSVKETVTETLNAQGS